VFARIVRFAIAVCAPVLSAGCTGCLQPVCDQSLCSQDADAGTCSQATVTQSGEIIYAGWPGGQGGSFGVNAQFWTSPVTGARFECLGKCTSSIGEPSDGGAPWPASVSAGTVVFRDLTTGDSLALQASNGGSGITYASDLAWNPGDDLQTSGTGGSFPAFTTTLVAPPDVTGTSPDLSASSITLSQSSPFTVSWTPASASRATVAFSLLGPDGLLYCVQDDNLGSITVPPSLLANLNVGVHQYEAMLQRVSTGLDTSTGLRISLSAATGSQTACNVTE
jgi:hypothetical protein